MAASVRDDGNPTAQRARSTRSSRSCDRTWRGIGAIPESGFALRDEYRAHDAERVSTSRTSRRGVHRVHQRADLARRSRSRTTARRSARLHAGAPLGATMVSSEGACAAYHAYGGNPNARTLRLARECRAPRMTERATFSAAPCPVPRSGYDGIVLGHGSGGRLSHDLLTRVFLPALGRRILARSKTKRRSRFPSSGSSRITTDSFVVNPLFFPGRRHRQPRRARHGERSRRGRRAPAVPAAAFILEEGLPDRGALRRDRRLDAARVRRRAGVELVTGDTKVVDRGKGDGVFITTTGVGVVPEGVALSAAAARPGDASSSRARSAITALPSSPRARASSSRPTLESDCAPLFGLVAAMLAASSGDPLHARSHARRSVERAERDRRRVRASAFVLDEDAFPLRAEVRGACELLGLDPLYVANEGKLVAIVARERRRRGRSRRCDAIRSAATRRSSARSSRSTPVTVTLRSRIGGERIVALLAGEQLPADLLMLARDLQERTMAERSIPSLDRHPARSRGATCSGSPRG